MKREAKITEKKNEVVNLWRKEYKIIKEPTRVILKIFFKMALMRSDILQIFVIFLLSFSNKRCYFISSDPVGLSAIGEELVVGRESFIMTSLWVNNRRKQYSFHVRSMGLILLLLCGDIHPCPGPLNMKDFVKICGSKIIHGNVRGLQSNLIHISSFLSVYPEIDIFGIIETHITCGLEEEEAEVLFQIPGFSFLSRSRPTGKGGGVGMYLSNNISFIRPNDLELSDIESIWIEITCKFAKNFLVCCLYRPTSSSRYLPHNFNARMKDMLTMATAEHKEIIIMGDVNVNYLAKEDKRYFKEILALMDMTQLIKEATRTCETTRTLIDIIASNNCKNIRFAKFFPSGFSDHDFVGCVRKTNHTKFKPKEIRCRDYNKYNPHHLNLDLLNANWFEVYSTNDVNIAWKTFHKIASTIFNTHAPIINKRVKSKPAPWLTSQIKALMNDRDRLYRKYQKSHLVCDRRAYQDKRNKVNITLHKARNNYNKELLKERSDDPEKFWKTLKRIYATSGEENPPCQSFDSNGEKCTGMKQIAHGFRSFFSTTVNHIKSQAMPLINFAFRISSDIVTKTYKTFHLKETTSVEICSIIKKLKQKTSTGCDNLRVSFFKDAIKEPLTYIINLSIKSGVIPADWKSARIIPDFKSGSRSQFQNYRPISILPIVTKIAEKVIHKQLMTFLEEKNLIYKYQFGFRGGMSTEQAVTLFLDEIRSNVDKGRLVGACFIDLKKAFDTISHSTLLSKLPKYGIHDRELEWFTDYLFDRKAIVQYGQERSEATGLYRKRMKVKKPRSLAQVFEHFLHNFFSQFSSICTMHC